MAKPRVTQTTSYDSSSDQSINDLLFSEAKEIPTGHPKPWSKIQIGSVKISDFRPILLYLRNGAR